MRQCGDGSTELGYDVWDDVLLASDWGVPQSRPRYICVAAMRGDPSWNRSVRAPPNRAARFPQGPGFVARPDDGT